MKNWLRYKRTILLKYRLFSNIAFLGQISEIKISNIPEYQDIYAESVKKIVLNSQKMALKIWVSKSKPKYFLVHFTYSPVIE